MTIKINNSREKFQGSITRISEKVLKDKYRDKYRTEDFRVFVKKYLREHLYIGDIKEHIDAKRINALVKESLGADYTISYDDELLKEVVSALSTMDVSGLRFIKAQIELYKRLNLHS